MMPAIDVKEGLSTWGHLAAFGMLVAGPCLLGWQCYRWMRDGEWPPVSVITALQWMEVKWSLGPTDWLGLFKLLEQIPLWIALIFAGVGAFKVVEWVFPSTPPQKTTPHPPEKTG